ncbi:SMP-30/gluconolactonase/LRE family protein [Catellatospora sp. KI3]|uniref:SMP-30/gluconolactonase/LRE family protein n=1 Tax=Catellatospora sp. KI3 TaxID=3041620 RepID=UPI0024830D6D|nr:SMP-30/gluconolactonase/LRE family protein [Catellatospora sp. KI3]MDI1461452.1 SMP-30/gluconolactonase/LRE family protein [Catellatospora sp. KI3]
MPRLKKYVTGVLGESPRWHDGRLWFSNWAAQEIVAATLDGKTEVVAKVPSFPFCFDWLPDGRMLIVSGGDAQVLRLEPDGTLAVHAELGHLSEHPFKDIVVDANGNAYVGNIGFDFPEGDFKPGFLVLVRPDGTAERVGSKVAFPHGLALAGDGALLVVAEAYANKLTAFPVAADGTLGKARTWAKLAYGVPHGITVDGEGAIWYSDVPNGEVVRVAEGGEELDSVEIGASAFACTLGGRAGKTLFVMAADWSGEESMAEGAETGRIVGFTAPAARAGRP